MEIREVVSNALHKVIISKVTDDEFVLLSKSRYSFTWKTLKGKSEVYKLTADSVDEILGVLALSDHPAKCRKEIKLLASSKENIGAAKNMRASRGV